MIQNYRDKETNYVSKISTELLKDYFKREKKKEPRRESSNKDEIYCDNLHCHLRAWHCIEVTFDKS